MPMKERIDRIGELLAKGVYLCIKNGKKVEEEPKNNIKKKAVRK